MTLEPLNKRHLFVQKISLIARTTYTNVLVWGRNKRPLYELGRMLVYTLVRSGIERCPLIKD